MKVEEKIIWQQAGGDVARNYVRTNIEFDVILNGPGYAGPLPDCEKRLKVDGCSAKKITDLKRFAEEMKDGDIVVLRLGTSEVYAVGEVVGDYIWMEEFGDIDGWDLQHVRRVRWLWTAVGEPQKFDVHALKMGDTTQRLLDGTVRSWLEGLSIPEPAYRRPLAILPVGTHKEASLEEISEYLYDQGVSSQSIQHLLAEIGELIRIAKWYARRNEQPSEHETVSYLAIPLLRALGWTPQRMAIEWNQVDVALFDKLPRIDSNLAVVVEAKRRNNSCLTALSQAQTYAETRPKCKRLIVSDGIRYGVYARGAEGFSLNAYLNLTRLCDAYPVYRCAGAKNALLMMTPEWSPGEIRDLR